jgi:CRP-like cAMP-binding protein
MNELEAYISSYFGVAAADIQVIGSLFRLTTLPKGSLFLKAGAVCNKLSFQKSGILRVYVVTHEKEITQWISTTGYFVTDLAGIVFGQPSKWNIQALTDSEVYTISREDYERLDKLLPQWPRLEKLFLAKCFLALEERIYSHLSLTAEQRYLALFSQQRELFQQVPAQYLASMLGMTPETMSRLRKRHRYGNPDIS